MVPAFNTWPTRQTFKQHWPKLALDLIVADWRHAGAYALSDITDIELELLDPPPPAKNSWQELYACDLEAMPALAALLQRREGDAPGDNLERLYEYAELSASERLVMRSALYGIPLDELAADLDWKLNTVQILYRNGLERILHVVQNGRRHERRSNGRLVRLYPHRFVITYRDVATSGQDAGQEASS